MPGGRLTDEDRRQIAAGLAEGLGYAEIGRRLGRPASTVLREVTRNGGPDGYGAHRAQEATRHRARRRRRTEPAPPPVPDGGHGPDPRAVQELVESWSTALVQQGMPRVAAGVLACLYVTDSGALAAAELAQRLRVSAASISHAVAFLEQQGLLRRERTPGVRRERYVIDDGTWARTLLATMQMNEALIAEARHAAAVLGGTTPAGARFESSAELLLLVNESLRRGMEQWRRRLAERSDDGG
ncbi:helix-turn-helix domain-containing protein [Kitasatospora sp. NPDC093550]|uniref:GbsR/MarR family transcriptional regulator n=1 Tax=Kitasatospora sp. NPDC093550 TaxID=3364089 RepID=UPI0038072AEF